MAIDSPVEFEFDDLKIKELVDEGSMDFDAWTRLISDVEKRYPEVVEKLSLVYEAFLSKYPLCYGYWRRYAVHMAHLCSVEKAVGVYERAVGLAPYSVAVWVDYCCFSISSFEDPFDICRFWCMVDMGEMTFAEEHTELPENLFRRGLSFVGKDYLCHSLWDKCIEYEFSQQHWSSLAHLYIQALKFPTKKLHEYYDSFKKFVSICELDMGCKDRLSTILPPEAELEGVPSLDDNEIISVINDLLDPSTRFKALQKYLLIGEQFYRKACQLNAKIFRFETNIHRPYFHVKSLDDHQLDNWHRYLDFVETQGDFDWAVKLYERCIIPCAYYPEFWMRYVDYVESKGGREIANDALDRATKTFLKSVPAIHVFNASFKEQIGDVVSARAAFSISGPDSESCFVDNVMKQANMEKRLGNFSAASYIYKQALEVAAEKKSNTLPILYIQFSRLQYMITKSVDSARDILLDAIQNVPHCKLLLTELLNFVMMHGGPEYVSTLDPIIADAISLGSDASERLNLKDRQDISNLYLELVNFCGTIYDVRRAWNRHVKLFPDLVRPSVSNRPARAAVCIYAQGHQDAVEAAGPRHMEGRTQRQLIHLQDIEEILPASTNSGQPEQAIRDNILSAEINEIDLNALVPVPSAFEQKSSADGHGPNELVDVVNGRVRQGHEMSNPVVNDVVIEKISNLNGIQEEREHGCKQELIALPLDRLSLNSKDKESPDFTQAVSKECAAPCEVSPSTGGMRESKSLNNRIPSTSSPVSACPNRSLSPSSMPKPSLESSVLESSQSQQCKPSVSKNWDDLISSEKGPREQWDRGWSLSPRRSSHRHSEDRDHQERSLSPHRHRSHWHSRDEQRHWRSHSTRRQGSRWNNENRWHPEKSRYHYRHSRYRDNSRNHRGGQSQNQDQDQIAPCHPRRMQNVRQQGSASTVPGQPIAYPQIQMNQSQLQSNEQNAQVQSSQIYNQMWQYYYYYQQLLQQQQSYNQQQFLQSQPTQQQLDMQSMQQQQMQPQTPQLQQMQPQQQQQMQPQQQQGMQSTQQQQVQTQPPQLQKMQPQQQQLQMQPLPLSDQQVQPSQLQLIQSQYQQQLQMYQQQQSQPLEQQQFNQRLQSQPQLLPYHLQQLQQHLQLLQQQQQLSQQKMQVQQLPSQPMIQIQPQELQSQQRQMQVQQPPSQQQIQIQPQEPQSQQQQHVQQQETFPYEQIQQQQYLLYLQQQEVLLQQPQQQPQLYPVAPEQDHQSSQQPKAQQEQAVRVPIQQQRIQPEREHKVVELEVRGQGSP